MDSVALIAPDFSIILLGLLLRLKFEYSEDFWKQAEQLVFYVLFPPLLFTSISGSSLSLGESAGFLAAGIGAMLIGVCASWCIRYLVKTGHPCIALSMRLSLQHLYWFCPSFEAFW